MHRAVDCGDAATADNGRHPPADAAGLVVMATEVRVTEARHERAHHEHRVPRDSSEEARQLAEAQALSLRLHQQGQREREEEEAQLQLAMRRTQAEAQVCPLPPRILLQNACAGFCCDAMSLLPPS